MRASAGRSVQLKISHHGTCPGLTEVRQATRCVKRGFRPAWLEDSKERHEVARDDDQQELPSLQAASQVDNSYCPKECNGPAGRVKLTP